MKIINAEHLRNFQHGLVKISYELWVYSFPAAQDSEILLGNRILEISAYFLS
jgi:hypothetical protein